MRFYNYINEYRDGLEKWKSLIKDKCKPYLKLVKGSDRLLFSGRKNEKPVIMKQVRQNRKPVDTPLEVHELLDNQFKDKFGIRARSNSIFCYFKNINMVGSDSSAYGDPYYIFPIGKFKTIWSPHIQDLFDEIQTIFEHKYFGDFDKRNWSNIREEYREEFLEFLEMKNYPLRYTDKPIKGMRSENTEVMVNCKEYIAVKTDIFKLKMKDILDD